MILLILAMLARLGAPLAFAPAIAFVVEHDAPPAGLTPQEGAALLIVYGWQESQLSPNVRRGDDGRAVCAFQVHADGARAAALEASPVACVRAAYAVMRASQALCGDLSGYCGACRGAFPRELARRRASDAVRLLILSHQPTTKEATP